MQARLKLFFLIGMAGLFALGMSMMFSNSNKMLAGGSGEGEKLFQANCLACHSIGGGNGVGPDLMKVAESRDEEWLASMIRDPKALADSGDETVNQLIKDYGMVMPTLHLSDDEIGSIVAYLESLSTTGASQENGSSQASKATQSGSKPLSLPLFALFGFIGVIILYGLAAGVWRGRLKGVRRSLR